MSDSDSEKITYSRADTIAAVSDYYKFLTAMYMDDSQVVYPPAGGWPSIVNADPDALKLLGKSDEVLSLLAHLPYVRHPGNWHYDADVAPMCFFADWRELIQWFSRDSDNVDYIRVLTEGDLGKIEVPHTIGLTCNRWDEFLMVLDTKLGLIHWCECPFEIKHQYFQSSVDYESDDDLDDDEVDDGDVDDDNADVDDENADSDGENVDKKVGVWRQDADSWAIPKFFEILKDQFKKLHWIPLSQRTVHGQRHFSEAVLARVRDIYHQHGWPDLAVYDKAKCLEAVNRVLEESAPRDVCGRHRGRLSPDPEASTNGVELTPDPEASTNGVEPTPSASL